MVIPLDLSPEEIARRAAGCSAVLLPGSKADIDPQKYGAERHPMTAPADVLRDGVDELLLQDGYNLQKPILGICYGLQALNVWRSGTLVQHIESKIVHSTRREIQFAHNAFVEPGSALATALGISSRSGLQVNSSHHQSAETAGDGLRVSAMCREDGVVEALEGTNPGHYVIGVQWHPERSFDYDAPSRRLFESFIQAAARWKQREPTVQRQG